MELKDLGHNQTVQLESDDVFRGVVYGQSTPFDPAIGAVILVYVVEPGKTGRRGVTRLPLADLRPVKWSMR